MFIRSPISPKAAQDFHLCTTTNKIPLLYIGLDRFYDNNGPCPLQKGFFPLCKGEKPRCLAGE
jgi:hypothetical protein